MINKRDLVLVICMLIVANMTGLDAILIYLTVPQVTKTAMEAIVLVSAFLHCGALIFAIKQFLGFKRIGEK